MSSLRMYMNEITEPEKDILSRQLLNSPFRQQTVRREPVILDIFDFDSTLFLSPLLSSNIWHSSFINTITTENLLGPGWWRDIRSLEIEDFEKAQANQWHGYWNEDIVKQVKESSADPTHMTVLLTGRRYYPFHNLIEAMLASKSLNFDLIGLRPDPDTGGPDHPKGLMFNAEPNVFKTTMDFKTSFIVNILSSVPTLTDVIMWDDRSSHISAFQSYLCGMVSKKIIKTGKLICVKPARPKYNYSWEYDTVNKIISSHNDAVLQLRNAGKKFVDTIVIIENYGQVITSANTFELKKVPCMAVLELDPKIIMHLNAVFKPLYNQDLLSTATSTPDWELKYAEEPVYFGNQVLLPLVEEGSLPQDEYQFRIVRRSKANIDDGMMLQVEMIGQPAPNHYILPLWYKPSAFGLLLKKDYQWIPIVDQLPDFLVGKVGQHYLLTVNSLEQ